MCSDISFKVDDLIDSISDYFPALKIDPQLQFDLPCNSHIQAHDRPNTQVIYMNELGEQYLTFMRWGLLQKYMFKDVGSFKRFGNTNYNTRAEKVFDKSSSWYKIRHQRCLIDVPGIYEHREVPGLSKKVPYYITLASKKRMLIPGFYSFVQLSPEDIDRIKSLDDKYMIAAANKILNFETGEITGTFSMTTTAGNQKMNLIHNHGANKHRMPLFMQPEDAVRWIDPNLSEDEMKKILQYQIPSEDIVAQSVWTIRSKDERPDSKLKHQPFQWEGIPAVMEVDEHNLLF